MNDAGDTAEMGGTLKYLKWLVTVLTVTMIGGFLIIVALFVMRFGGGFPMDLPDAVTLPDGAEAAAFTQGATWFAIVTTDDEILIFSRPDGTLRQTIRIEP